jgi:hypothetical protein
MVDTRSPAERLHDAMSAYAEAFPSRYDDDDRTPVRSRPPTRIRALPFVSGAAPFVPRRTRRPLSAALTRLPI